MTGRLIFFLAAQTMFNLPAFASEPDRIHTSSPSSLAKNETLDDAKAVSINNLFSYFRNNGRGASNPFTYDNGLEYKPSAQTVRQYTGRLEGGHLMCDEGLVWGGYHQGFVKVGGATFRGGLQAGPILASGTQDMPPVAVHPNVRYHVYRVRPDISSAVPAKQAEAILAMDELPSIVRYESAVTARSLYDAYCRDWNEWPASEGAPSCNI